MEFFVDGVRDPALAGGGQLGYSLDDVIDPDHVVGVEVYLGSTAPVRFGGTTSGRCGVVLIWTRATL
jgi:hypothetical protein